MWQAHGTMDLHEAEILAGLLRTEGIHAVVFNEGIARVCWLESLAYGGYRVMVPAFQARVAAGLVSAWRQDAFALPPGADAGPHCPHCHGDQVQVDTRRRGWALVLSVCLGLPMPWRWSRWMSCRHCKHRWPLSDTNAQA